MHPVRRNILFRWIGYAVVVVGMGSWIYFVGYQPPKFQSTVLQRLAPEKVNLPSEEVTQSIKSAIAVLKGEKPAFASVESVEQTLIKPTFGPDEMSPGGGMPGVKITALFLGPPQKYAILNGVAYKEGAQMADGRTLKTIKRDGVVLALGEAEQEVPWVPPFRVKLTKAKADKIKVFRPDEDVDEAAGAAETAPAGTPQAVDVDNLPPDLTPDQALDILQKMGKQ